MKGEKDILDIGKDKLQQLKTTFEELEVQLALGKAEAKEVFEREKKNIGEFINEQKARFKKEERVAEEHWDDLLEKFEALEANLNLETPDKKSAYDEMKKNTLRTIYELENTIKQTYGEVGTTFRAQLDQFKTKLDGYRIQLALSEFGKQSDGDNRRLELREKLSEIKDRMHKEEEDSNKMDDFVHEMSNSFDHLKKAFSDLFA